MPPPPASATSLLQPVAVETVVVSHQHTPDMPECYLESLVEEVTCQVIPEDLRRDGIRYFVMILFAGIIWPMTFRWFEAGMPRKEK